MRTAFCLLLCVACAAAGAAETMRPVRASFTSSPEGATVVIDGVPRGSTPITLYDIEPGTRHLRYEFRDYEPLDEFLPLAEGSFVSRHAELKPVLGLLLVTSEPAGATITLNGLSLGETPRLITALEVKSTHRLLLQKTGYQPRPVEVKFAGRTPLVRHEVLLLDSGVVDVKSEPSGAEVTVNGIVKGTTPCLIRDIPKGRATIALTKDGYKPMVRELALNAGDSQTLFLKLEGQPGTMRLTSVPDGARFYVNGAAEGKGPVTLVNLKPGTYSIRCELDGHATETRDVVLDNGATRSEEFRLVNVMGTLEVRTTPVGAMVFIDGHSVGTTRSSDANAEKSDVLIVPNLMDGEHTLLVRKDGFGEVIRHPVVNSKSAVRVNVSLKRLFLPNIEIETATGVYRGVLVDNSPAAILIETSPGVSRLFPRTDIRRVDILEKPVQP